MNIVSLQIPEDYDQQVIWLERHLLGNQLHQLVDELTIVHGSKSSSLTDLLGSDTTKRILKQGLKEITPIEFSKLLKNPVAILQLQEQILLHGGSYWDQYLKNNETIARTKSKLLKQIRSSVSPLRQQAGSSRSATNWSLVGLAAILLIGLSIGLTQFGGNADPQTASWGWLSDDAMDDSLTGKEYLQRLATGGDAWFKKTPTTAEEYVKRLGEMRDGCQRLIKSKHSPLNRKDAQWLVDKCIAWKSKFDAQFDAAKKAPADYANFQRETDETVQKLVKAINNRAELL